MSGGRGKETRQQKFWVTTELLPEIPRHVFYEKLNEMLADGVFECLMSQRAIAWRCADSLSLKSFLGHALCARTPDHSNLTRIRQRLPLDVHEQVFAFVLGLVDEHQLFSNKTVAVDATTLEADVYHADRGDGETLVEIASRLPSKTVFLNTSSEH